MVRYNFDAKPSFNLMDYKKQLVVGSAVLSILAAGYSLLKPSKIEQKLQNPVEIAQVQTNANSNNALKPEEKSVTFLGDMSNPLTAFFGKYTLAETQDKINSSHEQRLKGLEKRMEFAEEITGNKVVSEHSLDFNLDGNRDSFKLRNNNIAVVYLNDKESKSYEKAPFSAKEVVEFVSRYQNEYHLVPSKQTAQNVYALGINAEIIRCENLNDYSNLIKIAEVSPNCEK